MLVETTRLVATPNHVLQPSTRVEEYPFVSTGSVFAEPFVTTSSASVIIPFSEMTIASSFKDQPLSETTPSEKIPTIFDFYSVEAEAQFLKDHASLTDAEQAFYIRESVTQFLNEFAGNLPYSSISYLKRADGLYYGTIKANELYKKTAQMTKDGSREWAEYEGFLRLEEILEKTDAAIEVSPPLVADYGFVFFPKSTGQMVRMNVIRYPEKMHAVSKSREFQEVVTGVPCDYIHAHHFITQPVAVDSNILPQLLQTAGVSQEDIARAQEFERRVGLELSDSMNRYYAKLSACNGAVTAEKKTELEKLIADMYLRAREIREEIHYERQQGFQYSQINALQVNQHSPDHVMQSRSLLVPGGGSCPTVRRNGFLSQSDISEALSMNIPLEQKLRLNELSESNKDSGYDCPDCGKHYTDETHLPHEKRTKECTCGFKFGC